MKRLILAVAIAGLLAGCSGDDDKEAVAPTTESSAPTADAPTDAPTESAECVYLRHNDLTGERTEIADEWPETWYPASAIEGAIGMDDRSDPEADFTIIVPPCKEEEAAAIVERRQASDAEQAAQGIAFEDRIYP